MSSHDEEIWLCPFLSLFSYSEPGTWDSKTIATRAGRERYAIPFAMHPYQESSDESGIAAYQITPTSIVIQFKTGGVYLYNHAAPGRAHVKAMQQLAVAGDGLNTYINQHVREHYARKLS